MSQKIRQYRQDLVRAATSQDSLARILGAHQELESSKDKSERSLLAIGYAKATLGWQLDGTNQINLLRNVACLRQVIPAVCFSVVTADLEAVQKIDIVLKCLRKLHEACFSVSQEGRQASESEHDYEHRCRRVWRLMDEYDYAVTTLAKELKPFMLTLPEDVRLEYEKESAPFMKYVSGRDLRERMLFGK